jgi:hypothetical protein
MKVQVRSLAIGAAASLALLMYVHAASAQVDLSGTWSNRPEQDADVRFPGPPFADYLGIPLNDQARQFALLSYTPETINEVDRQCQPWPVHYIVTGPFGFRIYPTADVDGEVIAWNISGSGDREPMTIWMAGAHKSPPSPQALAVPAGFTTGEWQGDTLVTTTTHIQDGFLYRNGVPNSDQEVFTMYITRHGENLTITGVVQDPVYLTAPYVLAGLWVYDPKGNVGTPGNDPAACTPEEEVTEDLNGNVPSYMAVANNPNLDYMTRLYHIPHQAAMGGAQTMYPQYIKTISNQYTIPTKYCTYLCCGGWGASGISALVFDHDVLKCNSVF